MCTEERKPHPHAEVIKQWADGGIVQFFSVIDNCWKDCADNATMFHRDSKYRIKPEPIKTIGYRRYVYRLGGEVYVGLLQCTGFTSPAIVELNGDFVKWIDTEWQYETIEVK